MKYFEIPIKLLSKNSDIPTRYRINEWYDLRVPRDIELMPGEYIEVPLGIAMKLPEGYEALVVPRSSTFKRFRIIAANSIGVIDSAYSGNEDEWHFLVFSFSHMVIPEGSRICQFRLIECTPGISFKVVDNLESENRGGIGSTGK